MLNKKGFALGKALCEENNEMNVWHKQKSVFPSYFLICKWIYIMASYKRGHMYQSFSLFNATTCKICTLNTIGDDTEPQCGETNQRL